MTPVATPFFFYFISAVAVISSLVMITKVNPVHSALALIVTLLASAGLYLMLYAPSWLPFRSCSTPEAFSSCSSS